MTVEEVADRLVEFHVAVAHGDGGRQTVEAHDVGQHAQEARGDDIAALGKHTIQIAATPLPSACRGLHRKRHIRRCAGHAQALEQRDQARVGALVVDQEARVDTMLDAFESYIHGMCMAAKPALGLVQRDRHFSREVVGNRQPRNARTDDGNAAHSSAPKNKRGTATSGTPGCKGCCAAPRSEGGREGGGGEALRDCSQTCWKAAQQ